MKTYQRIFILCQSIENCIKSKNYRWEDEHRKDLNKLMESAPSGSGFDSGTKLIFYADNVMRFEANFHHMNSDGYYTKWTYHAVVVTPAFIGFDLKVTGKNHNDIKDYIGEVFAEWLDREEP